MKGDFVIMANYAYVHGTAYGSEKDINRFYNDSCNDTFKRRPWSCLIVEKPEYDSYTESWSADFTADVRYSLKSSFIDTPDDNIEKLANDYNLTFEMYSQEPGCMFQEHLIVEPGNPVCIDCKDWMEFCIDDYSDANKWFNDINENNWLLNELLSSDDYAEDICSCASNSNEIKEAIDSGNVEKLKKLYADYLKELYNTAKAYGESFVSIGGYSDFVVYKA